MTKLFLADTKETVEDFERIQAYLEKRGVALERWEAQFPLNENDDQETILKAYEHKLKPYMKSRGFQSADVINVHPKLENIEVIRQKFLKEHTHSEDEVRFFVDGEGKFWFHFESGEVVGLLCTKGDFLAVPAGFTHWFDLAPKYFVKAIRLFTSQEGWVANYTQSGIDEVHNGSF